MKELPWNPHELLPHSGAMVLIEKPIYAGEGWAMASVRIGEDSQFYQDGKGVPSWVGLEYMSQSVALYAGTQAKSAGQEIKIGLLLGTRRFDAAVEHFKLGQMLKVLAEEIWNDGQMAVFDCHIALQTQDHENRLCEARLSVFRPRDERAFLKDQMA